MSLHCMDHALTADIYIGLRRKVDFKEYKKKDVEIALANSLYSIVVFDEERPIGIARIVGDGRIAFFIKDVVVDPAYQKNRIGNLLMEKLHEYLAATACEGAYIGLMSTPNCVPFYKKHGFLERPCDGMGPGMVKFYDPCEVRK